MNENVIKNIANEVTRNCQYQNITVEPEFVTYIIELLLLNPKYRKLFITTINRDALEYFVGRCLDIIARGGTPLNTAKMQFIMRSNYDNLYKLIEQHVTQVDTCLKPLLLEIVDADATEDIAELKKIYRKIAIYIIMYSGLGQPSDYINLKEGMAAMESVFSLDDLRNLLLVNRFDRLDNVTRVMKLTSGVRIFNRDCDLNGETLPDLPYDLEDAGSACLASLSNSLITVMQRVNALTTAIEDSVVVDEETGTLTVNVIEYMSLRNYENIYDLLIFYRQYEVYIRRLLDDIQTIVATSKKLQDRYKNALKELHVAVKYKDAVPCDTIFPLFIKIWDCWSAMQNAMFLVSTINRLMAILSGIQEHNKIPFNIIEKMLEGKTVTCDEERMNTLNTQLNAAERHLSLRLMSEDNHPSLHAITESGPGVSGMPRGCGYSVTSVEDTKHVAFFGFCVMCLNVGALVPCNLKIGFINYKEKRYGFASLSLAAVFIKDPDRYVNTSLQFARDHPQIINLLHMEQAVRDVMDIEQLLPETHYGLTYADKDVQTELHTIEQNIDQNYFWNLWEYKRKARKLASLTHSRTHSTQTHYSHWRSEVQCQTVVTGDKNLQTRKEAGTNSINCHFFFWGLRGHLGEGAQHLMDLMPKHSPAKPKPQPVEPCSCEYMDMPPSESYSSSEGSFVETRSALSLGKNLGYRHKNKVFYPGGDVVE